MYNGSKYSHSGWSSLSTTSLVVVTLEDGINLHLTLCLIVPTGAPLNISAVPIGSTSVLLTWEAPRADTQNGIVRSYNISVVELESGEEWSLLSPGSDTYRIVTSLHPFYRYNCTVAAYTIATGPTGSTVVQTLPEGIILYTTYAPNT